jgi:hypothetical protein
MSSSSGSEYRRPTCYLVSRPALAFASYVQADCDGCFAVV